MMKKKIDLHTHVLPHIDDGAKNLEMSLNMLYDSFSQGVELCAATPHAIVHKASDVEHFLEKRKRGYDKVRAALCNGMPKVLLGAEVYLDNDLNIYKDIEKLCLEGTRFIMLEFPVLDFNPRWAEWIYNLNRRGLKVLVAHVDRYAHWEKMMLDFKGLDIEYQVNASRFLEFGSGKLIKKLFEYNNRYIISSDMHNMTSRCCNMAKAYEKAVKKYPDKADGLFFDNARHIFEKS